MNLKNIQLIRAGRFIYSPCASGPATVREYPSISAAKREVRASKLPLGQARKLTSLQRELGDLKFERLMKGGYNNV